MTYLAPPPQSSSDARGQNLADPHRPVPTHAICIATYRRPESLRALLGHLAILHRRPRWRIEVRVIDNDEDRSAAAVVGWFTQSDPTELPVRYLCEPRRNIAIARNRALDLGPAEWIAWIDDDEVPEPDWLLRLQEAADRTDADAVIGPVHARYPTAAPGWLTRGRFLDKPVPSGGVALDWTQTRSCNALVRGDWLFDFNMRFNPRFGRSGGEDSDLFRRLILAGANCRPAQRAVVIEAVHLERCTVRWHLARQFRCAVNFERMLAGTPNNRPWRRLLIRSCAGTLQTLGGLPGLLIGRAEYSIGGLLSWARALGGLWGQLAREKAARRAGYPSTGTLPEAPADSGR